MSGVFSTATRLRMAIAAVVVLVNAVQGGSAAVLPWALLVVTCDVIAGFLLANQDVLLPHRSRQAAAAATMAGAVSAGLSTLTGVGALPLFVIPLFRAGEKLGRRVVGSTSLALAAGAVLGGLLLGPGSRLSPGQVFIWVALAAGLGVLASWEERITPLPAGHDPVTDEAAVLLTRLRALSDSLEGGLDPATLAARMLDDLPPRPRLRAAVLTGPAGGTVVPLALRGAARVPWAEPQLDDTTPLGTAWAEGSSAHAVVGERTMVAVPLIDTHDEQVGVLACDWAGTADDAEGVEAVIATTKQHGTGLAVALSYMALRDQASVDERRQIAKSMHDGIAQEVAALGFQLDMIRYAAQQAGDATASDLAALRGEFARVLADLRTDITDLRIGLRPQDGLGATVSTRLQQFGTATGCAVAVSLRESGFRLPASTEVAIYRLLLDVLADAQRQHAHSVDVSLVVAAPHFDVTISHDAATGLALDKLRSRLTAPDTVVELTEGPGGPSTTSVRARMTPATRGGSPGDLAALASSDAPQGMPAGPAGGQRREGPLSGMSVAS